MNTKYINTLSLVALCVSCNAYGMQTSFQEMVAQAKKQAWAKPVIVEQPQSPKPGIFETVSAYISGFHMPAINMPRFVGARTWVANKIENHPSIITGALATTLAYSVWISAKATQYRPRP